MTVETRVRTLTDYDTEIISSSDMDTLIELSKDEIKEDTGMDEIDFSSGAGKSALMWLTCIFSKIHVGEIGAEGYQIGEIETKDLNDQAKVWFGQYRSRRSDVIGTKTIGHAKPSRSGRSYGDE